MAITRAQQFRQMLEDGGMLVKPGKGKRPGYRGDAAARSTGAAQSGRADPGDRGDVGESGRGGDQFDTSPSGRFDTVTKAQTQRARDFRKQQQEARRDRATERANFAKSLAADRKRAQLRRAEIARKKGFFNFQDFVRRTKDANLASLGQVDQPFGSFRIGKVQVPALAGAVPDAFYVNPATDFFDKDSLREIASTLTTTQGGLTKQQTKDLRDLREDIDFQDRLNRGEDIPYEEKQAYINRNKDLLPDREDEPIDPCLGPNPPDYCFIGKRADETIKAQAQRNLAGLTARIGGSLFAFDKDPITAADGGRIGYRMGGGPIKSFFEFLNKKNPVQAYRDYLKSIKDKTLKANETGKFTDLPIAEVGIPAATGALINRAVKKRLEAESEKLKEKEPEKKASGGRIGLKMGRRAFLKALGAGLAGTAAVKSGIVSLGGKTAGKEAVKQVVKTPSVAGKPEWFDSLVNKVIREGDDVTKNFATKEREIVHVKKIDEDNTVRVTQDLDEGAITVEYESPDNVFGDTVQLKYKKPLPDEGDPRPSAEFEVAESGPVGRQTSPDDYDIEIDEVGGNNIKDLSSDVSKLKEYATGKKPTIREMIQNKKRKDKAAKISEDPEARMDDVIRRQGEMLDDQDFASGGLAAMLGE